MNVCAVTVTYGNRARFVASLAENVLAGNVHKLIIVDNGSPPKNKENLWRLRDRYPRKIDVISLDKNTGSAGGFKTGIIAAERDCETEFVWLLDDDNLPDPNARQHLLATYQKLNEACCLVSLRKDRLLYRKIFNEADVKRKFTAYNSFINYSLRHAFQKKLLYSRKRDNLIAIPYAPYGGMFFHKKLLKTIGYPLEQMYLYRDDHEYSHRIVQAGLKIYLDRRSTISDMEVSWHGQKKYRFLGRFRNVLEGDENKAYYIIRNSIFLEEKYFVTNRWEYAINRFLYMATFYPLSILLNKPDRIKLFKKAYADSVKMKERGI